MHKIVLNVKSEYIEKIMEFIKTLPEGVVEIDDNSEGEQASEEDIKRYNEAQKEYKAGEFVSLEDFEKEISDV
jgi:hypothetical protein